MYWASAGVSVHYRQKNQFSKLDLRASSIIGADRAGIEFRNQSRILNVVKCNITAAPPMHKPCLFAILPRIRALQDALAILAPPSLFAILLCCVDMFWPIFSKWHSVIDCAIDSTDRVWQTGNEDLNAKHAKSLWESPAQVVFNLSSQCCSFLRHRSLSHSVCVCVCICVCMCVCVYAYVYLWVYWCMSRLQHRHTIGAQLPLVLPAIVLLY